MNLSKDFIGFSVSHGTLRTCDLLVALGEFITEHNLPGVRQQGVWVKWGRLYSRFDRYPSSEAEQMAEYVLEDMFDKLNDIAPKGCYFGSHPGDASDFGFWQVEE